MRSWQKTLQLDLIRRALRELSDYDCQLRVWVLGDPSEMSSMTEAVEALFSDSGLGDALEKAGVVFKPDIDAELRELRADLHTSLSAELETDTSAVIHSAAWNEIRTRAGAILRHLDEFPVQG